MRKKHEDAGAERDASAAPGGDARAEAAAEVADAARIDELNARLAEATADLARRESDYLRARADLENFRRRAARETIEAVSFARRETLVAFLDLLDDLDRALEEPGDPDSPLRAGVALIRDKMLRLLRDLTVEPIETSGAMFDPELHEALGGIPSADAEPNSILREIRKGYRMEGRVLRPARVLVALPPPVADAAEGA